MYLSEGVFAQHVHGARSDPCRERRSERQGDMSKLVLKIINIENPYFGSRRDLKESVLKIADYSQLLEDSSNLVNRQDSSDLTSTARVIRNKDYIFLNMFPLRKHRPLTLWGPSGESLASPTQ